MTTARTETDSARREALAEKLSPHLTPEKWRAVFHGTDPITFDEAVVTTLYAETTLMPGWGDPERDGFVAEVERLAARHGGEVDLFVWGASVVVLQEPHAAVRMALDLQRGATASNLRIGVHTGEAVIASFACNGIACRTLIGAQVGRAAKVAASAAKGSIVISPDTYVLVHKELHDEAAGCLLTEEFFHDSRMAQALITPAPARGAADLSTFAGLGLT
ncbi:adenylate/guanylate cyclase domain-containing protein [Ramlibacter albus]|uniref:Adenylate/guanylate cyclase domain-containing protein n=1 Tax=Ramlibacter albus TaxID=2079448 RepID=A0A923M7F1_9BURK|nr:adenylate/guanylate cyclase domain-containing protein [Ramlibacter albus]MBC5764278.1 hypothetical protein [Ramlibacter albus]